MCLRLDFHGGHFKLALLVDALRVPRIRAALAFSIVDGGARVRVNVRFMRRLSGANGRAGTKSEAEHGGYPGGVVRLWCVGGGEGCDMPAASSRVSVCNGSQFFGRERGFEVAEERAKNGYALHNDGADNLR